jgi:hypothetical protein
MSKKSPLRLVPPTPEGLKNQMLEMVRDHEEMPPEFVDLYVAYQAARGKTLLDCEKEFMPAIFFLIESIEMLGGPEAHYQLNKDIQVRLRRGRMKAIGGSHR